MWNNAMYETERRRIAEKQSEQRIKFIQGLILAPVLLLGWFPILWIIAKLFAK
jgi:hypothetical protein